MAGAGVFLTLAPETFIDSSVLNLSISMPNAIDAVAAAAVDKNPRKPLVTSAEIAEIQLKPLSDSSAHRNRLLHWENTPMRS